MTQNAILFDLGATKTRIAYSSDGLSFEEPIVFPTSQNYEEGTNLFLENIKQVANKREIKKIVGGMSRNISGWTYDGLKESLSKIFKAEIFIENDAAMAGLGEAVFGAGKGFEIVAYLTVSTGVGGVRIVGKKIDEKFIGFEPGKQIIDIEGDINKTLEDFISGSALARQTGKDPKEITDPKVWDDLAQKLAVGLNNIIVEWSPDVVVLGGSMITGDPAISIDKAENHLKGILKIFPNLPSLKKAELADFGGLWGGLAFFSSPS